MATEVENRVVQMTFNNKSFEKGVETTLKTIDKLNNALKFKGASKGFQDVEKASEDVDFRTISSQIDKLSEKFSGLGIIGMKIWSNIGDAIWNFVTSPLKNAVNAVEQGIGKVTNQIKTGGWNRALNLEKAQKMLKNLEYGWDSTVNSEEMVDENGKKLVNTYYYVNKAVTDTQFSLDQAASAAANFLASGVKNGEELYDTLRSVMGVSSTFSADFDQVAMYMQKIASQGYLSGEVATNMTQTIGVPIRQMLAEYLNMSGEQIEEAIRKKAINFDIIRDMFQSKFGESLDKANETYTGALSNFNAALSRIGAKFAEPLLKNLIPILNTARIFANDFSTALTESGIVEYVTKLMDKVGEFSKTLIKLDENGKTHVTGPLKSLIKVGQNILTIFTFIAKAVVNAFKAVFVQTKKGESGLDNLADKTTDWVSAIKKAYEKGYITNFFIGVFTALKAVFTVLKTVIKIVGVTIGIVIKAIHYLAIAVDKILQFVGGVVTIVKESEPFKKALGLVKDGFNFLKDAIQNGIDAVGDFIDAIFDFIEENEFIDKALNGIKTGFELLCGALSLAWGAVSGAFELVISAAKDVINKVDWQGIADTIYGTFKEVPGVIKDIGTSISDLFGLDVVIPKTWEALKQFWKDVSGFVIDAKNGIIEFFSDLSDNPQNVGGFLGDMKDSAAESLSDGMVKANEKMEKFADNAKKFADGWNDSAKGIKNFNEETKNLDESDQRFSFFDGLALALGAVSSAFGVFTGALRDLGKAVTDVLFDAFAKFKELLGDDASLEHALEIFKQLVGIWATSEWGRAGKNFADLAGSMADGIAKLTGVTGARGLNSISKLLKSIAKAILLISISIVLIAAAMRYVMESKNFNNLHETVQAFEEIIGVIISAILIFMIVMNKITKKIKKEPKSLADKVSGLADKFKLLGDAMAKVDFIGLAATIAAVAWGVAKCVKAVALLAAVMAIPGVGSTEVATAAMVLLGVIVVMYIFIRALASMLAGLRDSEGENLSSGLEALAKMMLAVGIAIALIAGAISVIAIIDTIASKLGNEDAVGTALDTVFKMMLYMAGFMLAILAVMLVAQGIMGDRFDSAALSDSFLGIALVLVALGAVFLMLVPLFAVFALMKPETLTETLGAVFVLMVMLFGFAALMIAVASGADPEALSEVPKIILTIAVCLLAASAALAIMATSDPKTNIQNALSITIVFLIMAIIIGAIGAMGIGDAAAKIFLGIAVALVACAASLKILSGIDQESLQRSVVCLVIICLVLTVLGGVIKVIPGVSKGMEALGASLLMAGVGIFLIAAGITLLASLLDTGIAALDGFVVGFIQLCEDLKPLLSEFVEAIVVLIVGIVVGVLNGLAESIGDILFAIGNILVNGAKGLGWIAYGLADAIIQIIIGIAMAFSDRAGEIGYAVGIFFEALLFAFTVAIATFVAKVLERFRELLGIASPSKETEDIGDNTGMGFLEGLKLIVPMIFKFLANTLKKKVIEGFNVVKNAMVNFAYTIVTGVMDAFSSLKDKVEDVIGAIGDFIDSHFGGIVTKVSEGLEKLMGDADKVYQKGEEARAAAKKGAEEEAARIRESYGIDEAYKSYEENLNKARALALSIQEWELKGLNFDSSYRFELSNYLTATADAQKKLLKAFAAIDEANVGYGFSMTVNGKEMQGIASSYREIAEMASKGFMSGIKDESTLTNETIYDWMTAGYGAAKEALEIKSPSRVFADIGMWTIKGYNEGISKMEDTTYELMSTIFDNVESIPEDATIRPVFDFSGLQNGAGAIAEGLKEVKANSDISIDTINSTNTGRLSALSDLVYDLIARSDTTGLSSRLDSQNEIIGSIVDKLDGIGVYVDSGVLVGVMTPKIDASLGKRVGQAGRSVRS